MDLNSVKIYFSGVEGTKSEEYYNILKTFKYFTIFYNIKNHGEIERAL